MQTEETEVEEIQQDATVCRYLWALLFFTLDAELLARSHYSEGPATDHLDTGFSWFPCV